MKILKFIFFIALWTLITTSSSYAQYIFYGKPVENLSLDNKFLIMGDIDGQTLVYYTQPPQNLHTVGFYDKKMKLLRQQTLSSIPTKNKIIAINKLSNGSFAFVHSEFDQDRQKQNCYISVWSPTNPQKIDTKLVESISYNSDESIFRVAQSPSRNFFTIFVFGQKNEDTSAIVSYLFSDNGERIKQSINFFSLGIYSTENIEQALLNDKGDLFFYSTLVDKFKRYMYVKAFFQLKDEYTLTSRYMDLTTGNVEVTAIYPFYNSVNNSWNLISVYQYTEQKDFSQGIKLLSWECKPNNSLMTDYAFSFSDYLSELKKRVDPNFFEDIALNNQKIKNKSLIDMLKELPKEQEEESEETNIPPVIPMIDEDDEVLTNRFQSLLELFSFSKVEIMNVMVKSDGHFTLFLENRPSGRNDGMSDGSFLNKISPSLVVGFGGGVSMGTGTSSGSGIGAGISIPIGGAGGTMENEANQTNTEKKLNDLTVMDFSSEGKFQWGVNINKKQSSNLGDNLSYFSIKRKENIHIFYVNQGAPAYVYSIKIVPNGQMEVKPTVRGVSTAYSMIPMLSYQTNINSTVIPCLYKEKLVFSRLVYE